MNACLYVWVSMFSTFWIINIHILLCISICKCVWIDANTLMHTPTHMYCIKKQLSIFVHIVVCAYMCLWRSIPTYIYTDIYMSMDTYLLLFIHIHVRVHAINCVCIRTHTHMEDTNARTWDYHSFAWWGFLSKRLANQPLSCDGPCSQLKFKAMPCDHRGHTKCCFQEPRGQAVRSRGQRSCVDTDTIATPGSTFPMGWLYWLYLLLHSSSHCIIFYIICFVS